MSRLRFVAVAASLIVVGVALQLPSLGVSFYGDDSIHQLVLGGTAPSRIPLRPWSLYDFGTGEDWRASAADGAWVPIWWISPDWKIRFLAPAGGTLRPVQPPAPGETLLLPQVPYDSLMH